MAAEATPSDAKMIWNYRITRITVGLLLLALVVVLSLPAITGFTSLDGTVNARFAVVNAPIDGTVAEEPLKVGSPVKGGTVSRRNQE
ncbi:hypothetical protein FHX08_005451 [Rhizobium sp. BK529]|nr:hypothetical protein [Rhizobium sp. BK529]